VTRRRLVRRTGLAPADDRRPTAELREPRWLHSTIAVVAAALAVMVGPLGWADAAATTHAYDTAVYAYDGPALLSSPDTGVTYVRGWPPGPGAASWVSPVSVRDRGVAADSETGKCVPQDHCPKDLVG
jgi:hypothetical protein